MRRITLDFETRSEANLKKVGAWMYSRHPSTDVTCLGWRCDGEVGQWKPGDPEPKKLMMKLLFPRAYVAVAHNSFFEYCIWLNVCHRRYGWTSVPDGMWRCTAAKAASCSLPRALGDAGRALKLDVVKDNGEGKSSMLKLSRPRKPTAADPGLWRSDPEDVRKMLAYNMTDVEAEEALDAALPDLSPQELRVWQMTERMNRRGVALDVAGARAAVKIAGEYAAKLTAEFHELTGLDTAGQRAKFMVWAKQRGTTLPDTQADTLDAEIARMRAGQAGNTRVCRAMEIVRALGRSSVKKYRAGLEMADSDGRVRGVHVYCGAQRTGRWSGSGMQPQNFKREGPPDMDKAWDDIRTGDLEYVEMLHGDPLEFLSKSVRGMMWAPPGRQFYSGDFAQIEVRKLFWLAGERRGLDVFRRGEDPYLDMARTIYNRIVEKWESERRFLGKQATLALGFGAGYIKFLLHCRDLGAPPFSWAQVCEAVPTNDRKDILAWILRDDWHNVKKRIPGANINTARELVLSKYINIKYRKRYENTVVKFWHALERAAKAAVARPGATFPVGRVSFQVNGKFLDCTLPSGRVMRYFEPELRETGLTYMNIEEGRWQRVGTYGGKLAENVTQASARDVEAEALLRLEDSAYRDIAMTVHDDATAETDVGVGSVREFAEIMAAPPSWCADLPIKVDAWVGRRYHK